MKNTAKLPSSLGESHALILAQQEEIKQLHVRYKQALEQFKLAQQRKFTSSSESHVLQMDIQFDEADSVPAEELPKEESTLTIT